MAEENQDTTTSGTQEEIVRARTLKNSVTIEQTGPCKKKVIVEIPEETIKGMADEQYLQLRREAVVPGFRKGRAPRRLLEKRFGKETREQIKLKLLVESSDAAIKDNELDILGDADIDYEHIELPETGAMRYEFEVEVRPEFELPSLEGIPVTQAKLEVTDEQVDREIEQMRRWSGTWTPREDGTVERDDQIIADVRLHVRAAEAEQAEPVTQAEGRTEESEATAAPLIAESETKLDNAEVYVRPNGFVGPIPVERLDELLLGARAGDKKTTTVQVPQTFFREEFQGRTIDVEIDIKDIKHLKPAEMDEHFLQHYHADSVDELRQQIRDHLQAQLESRIRNDMSEQIYQYLLDNTDFDLPTDIVAQQAGSVLQRQYINLLARGLSRQQIDEHMERLRAGSEEQAKQQLKTFFIMDKVADKLDVEVSEEEINGHIAQVAVQRGQRPEKLREQMERDGSLAQFRLNVRQSKCVSKLLESASVAEQESKEKPKKRSRRSKKESAEEKAAEQQQ